MIDSSILDSLISGRVDPHIYGFSTNTVPNYLKVGDSYRPVRIRLNEWRRYFPDLIPIERSYSARIDDEHIFRDYAVHDFLIRQKHRERLQPEQIPDVYYSNEFFKEATEIDIREAIADIRSSAANGDGRYQFYGNDHLPTVIIPEIDANDNNIRIAQHVGIQKQFLQLIFEKGSEFKLSRLDCTIENVNALGRDESLAPIERAKIAMHIFVGAGS